MRTAIFFLFAIVAAQGQSFPSPNITQPSVIYKVDPEYTPEAKAARLEGTVTVKATILIDGTASDIKVVRSLGMGLDEKAVECVKKWRFKVATRDSEPAAVPVTIEVNFRLR